MLVRSRLRTCSEPGCPNDAPRGGRCPSCLAEYRKPYDRARPSKRERGYDGDWERNRRIVIREEDTCWLCGQPVNKNLRGTDPLGPSVDHVVPLARGGSNARGNLRLAHFGCNSSRNARGEKSAVPGAEQEARERKPGRYGSPGLR